MLDNAFGRTIFRCMMAFPLPGVIDPRQMTFDKKATLYGSSFTYPTPCTPHSTICERSSPLIHGIAGYIVICTPGDVAEHPCRAHGNAQAAISTDSRIHHHRSTRVPMDRTGWTDPHTAPHFQTRVLTEFVSFEQLVQSSTIVEATVEEYILSFTLSSFAMDLGVQSILIV